MSLLSLTTTGERNSHLSDPDSLLTLPTASYPSQVAGLLYDRPHSVGRKRFHISGYSEQGTTTTPFLSKCILDVHLISGG